MRDPQPVARVILWGAILMSAVLVTVLHGMHRVKIELVGENAILVAARSAELAVWLIALYVIGRAFDAINGWK